MKITTSAVASAILLAGAAASQNTWAQGACGEVDFATAITNRFPNVADACLGIETRNGRQFAHFEGEVVSVTGNEVRARFRRPGGGFGPTVTVNMPADARVEIGGRSYRYRELSRGQELDIYVPPDLWEFHMPDTEDFATAQQVAVVTPSSVEQPGSSSTLPRTASPLPLIGLAGGVLTMLGFALAAVRRRLG